MSRDAIKKSVAHKAAEFVMDGMRVGLGTGSTAYYFIERLIERCRAGLKIEAVASSNDSFALAKKDGFQSRQLDAADFLTDLYSSRHNKDSAFVYLQQVKNIGDAINN